MNKTVLQTIAKHRLITPGDSVLVGLSGGADSVALVHFLFKKRQALGISTLRACHINHNLRGDEALRDESFVRRLCAELAIPLDVCSVDVNKIAREQGLSTELAARKVRYACFEELAKEHRCKIATAHTLSDSMETIIFNLARGSGTSGLSGIPVRRDGIIRPLIEVTRELVEAYCKEHDLSYVTDSTNKELIYTRNKIRHQIVPLLYEINPTVHTAFMRASSILAEQSRFMESCAKQTIAALQTPDGFSTEQLMGLDPALLSGVLLALLEGEDCSPSYQAVEGLSRLIAQGSGALQLSRHCTFEVIGGFLRVKASKLGTETPQSSYEIPLEEGVFPLPTGKRVQILLIDCKKVKFCEKSSGLDLKNLLDYDRIRNIAVIRPKMSGDVFTLPRRNVSKSLKKLLSEDKVPADQRSRLLLIADDDGVIWVEGYGAAPRASVSDSTKIAFQIKIISDEMEHTE